MPSTSDIIVELDNALAQALLYSDFEELASVDHALKYVTAVRRLVLLKPKAVTMGGSAGESFVNDLDAHLALMKIAQSYIGRRRAIAETTMYTGFGCYRE